MVKTGFLNHQQYGKGFLVSCIHDKELVYQHGPGERPLFRLNCAVIFSKILSGIFALKIIGEDEAHFHEHILSGSKSTFEMFLLMRKGL